MKVHDGIDPCFFIKAESLPWPKIIKLEPFNTAEDISRYNQAMTFIRLSEMKFYKIDDSSEYWVSDETYRYLKNVLNEFLIFVWADSGR